MSDDPKNKQFVDKDETNNIVASLQADAEKLPPSTEQADKQPTDQAGTTESDQPQSDQAATLTDSIDQMVGLLQADVGELLESTQNDVEELTEPAEPVAAAEPDQPQQQGDQPTVSQDNIDQLLESVQNDVDELTEPADPVAKTDELAEHTENLEQLDQVFSQQADQQLPQQQQQTGKINQDADLAAEPVDDQQSYQPDDDAPELDIDQQDEKLTDEEIKQALANQGLDAESSESDSPKKSRPATTPLAVPKPIEVAVTFLEILDKPFCWVPIPAKRVIGYLAAASTIAALTAIAALSVVT